MSSLSLGTRDRGLVERLSRPALAWEILRRDPAYRAAFEAERVTSQDAMVADPEFARLWGVHFP